MITFVTEPWDDIRHEILPLWLQHHAVVADPDDFERIPPDPDWAKYQAAADKGCLQILAARDRGELVGYVFMLIDTHLHYRSTLCAFLDLYWISPDKRGHMMGVRMFRAVEAACVARGVKKMFGGTKLWLDARAIFHRCGWKEAELAHTKWIGG